jgi:hypothetical protein
MQLGERFAVLRNQAYSQRALGKLVGALGARVRSGQSEDEPPSGCRGG